MFNFFKIEISDAQYQEIKIRLKKWTWKIYKLSNQKKFCKVFLLIALSSTMNEKMLTNHN